MITPKLHIRHSSLVDEKDGPWFCLEILKELVDWPDADNYWIELTTEPKYNSIKVQLCCLAYYPRYRFDDSRGRALLPASDNSLDFLGKDWENYYFRVWYS